MQGKIIKGIAGFYYVHVAEQGIYECKAKGVFRNKKVKPIVGDNVEIDILDDKERTGNITRVLERKNRLIRPEVANIDQSLIIFALQSPKPNLHLLDCFLVMMERQNVPCVICFNKTDLEEKEKIEEMKKIYENSGYQVICCSTLMKEGVEVVYDCLKGKTTALAGPSGVGKSSMLNAILGKRQVETGSVSEKIGRGRHTTRHTEIFEMGDHTYLMDTPGFSSLYAQEDMEKEELKKFFREFQDYEGTCRFIGCVHIDEPDCGVKEAVACEKISMSRYENYKWMYQNMKEAKKGERKYR